LKNFHFISFQDWKITILEQHNEQTANPHITLHNSKHSRNIQSLAFSKKAEKKKVQSQEIQHQLAEQTVKIEEKRKDVMADLVQVEPAVIDAQAGKILLPPPPLGTH